MYEQLVRNLLGLTNPEPAPAPVFRRKSLDEIFEGKGVPRGGAASLTPIPEPGSVAAMNAQADAEAARTSASGPLGSGAPLTNSGPVWNRVPVTPPVTPAPSPSLFGANPAGSGFGTPARPPLSLTTPPLRTQLFSTPEDWSFQANPPQQLFGNRTPTERAEDRLNATTPGLWKAPAPIVPEPVQPTPPGAMELFRKVARSPYEGLPDGLLDETINDLAQGHIKPQPFTQPEGEFNKSIKRWLGHMGAGLSRGAGAAFNAMGEPVNAAHHADLTRRAEQWIADNQPRISKRDDVENWGDLVDLWGSQAGSVAPRSAVTLSSLAFPPIRPITATMSFADWTNRLFPSDHDMPQDLP